MPFIVAIDGPAGAGKSTVARKVAAALGLTYLDTGAMYRSVALQAARRHIAPDDVDALADMAATIQIRFSRVTTEGAQQVYLFDEDVTDAIRTPAISSLTSAISAFPPVRRVIVDHQRRIAARDDRGVVLEGRDIGTVVFPDANVKIFLTASSEERARRRCGELQAKGVAVEYTRILAEQQERDQRDSERADSPLKPAADSAILNTDNLSIDQVVDRILTLCRARTE